MYLKIQTFFKLTDQINKQKKIWKKHFEKKNIFLKVLKVRRPGSKTSGFQTVRILKNFWTSAPDMMSGRALVLRYYNLWITKVITERKLCDCKQFNYRIKKEIYQLCLPYQKDIRHQKYCFDINSDAKLAVTMIEDLKYRLQIIWYNSLHPFCSKSESVF